MKDSPSPTGNIVTSLIFFGVTAAIAIILFIDAFVMWLASLTSRSTHYRRVLRRNRSRGLSAGRAFSPELHPGPDRNGLRGRFPDQGWV